MYALKVLNKMNLVNLPLPLEWMYDRCQNRSVSFRLDVFCYNVKRNLSNGVQSPDGCIAYKELLDWNVQF